MVDFRSMLEEEITFTTFCLLYYTPRPSGKGVYSKSKEPEEKIQ